MNKVKPDVRQLRSGRWQARLRLENGSRQSLGTFATEAEAEQAWWTAKSDLKRGQWWDDSKGGILFSDFTEQALGILAKSLTVGTIRNYRTLANKNLLPVFGHLPLNKISRPAIKVWWATMPDTQNSRNAFYCLRAIMREAEDMGLIKDNPVRVKGAAKDRSTPRPDHTYEEFLAVVDHLPFTLKTPAWVLFGAHLRVSEMAGLNRGDFDPKTGQLRVERQDSEIGGRHLRETKTKQKRSLAILEPAATHLRKYHSSRLGAADSPMFVGTTGARLSARRFRIHWEKACGAAGIENFHVHDIRHIGLTLVARSGATNADIKRRGGHASDSAAARYQHSSVVRDEEIAARVSERFLA